MTCTLHEQLWRYLAQAHCKDLLAASLDVCQAGVMGFDANLIS